MKIRLLWGMERWLDAKKEAKVEKRSPRLWGKHKRVYGFACDSCGNERWIKRKNHRKCTKCGNKVGM